MKQREPVGRGSHGDREAGGCQVRGVTEEGGYFRTELWRVGPGQVSPDGGEGHAFSGRRFQKGLEDREQSWEGL